MDMSEYLIYENKKLKMQLEACEVEKMNSAECGLTLLEEQNKLRLLLEEKETAMESLSKQLLKTQEALACMQSHTRMLEEADELDEIKRTTNQEAMMKKIIDLELEVKKWRRQMELCVGEKKKMEDIVRDVKTLAEEQKNLIIKLKCQLKNSELREHVLQKDCNIVELDNVELQQQVNSLMKSLQHFDNVELENRMLTDKNELLSSELKKFDEQKCHLDKTLTSTLEMLKEEREMKMTYKRQLDSYQHLNDDDGAGRGGSLLNQSIAYSSIYQSIHQDCSIDNITMLLDSFHSNDDEDEDEDGQINNNNNKMIKSMKNDLMSELMKSCDDYVANMDLLQNENEMLKNIVEELQQQIKQPNNIAMKNSILLQSCLNNLPSTTATNIHTSSSSSSTQTTISTEEACSQTTTTTSTTTKLFKNTLAMLRTLCEQLIEMLQQAKSTYTTICDVANEKFNSKAMLHVEKRLEEVLKKINENMLQGCCNDEEEDENNNNNNNDDDDDDDDDDGGITELVISCCKLIGSSNDLMRYSNRVVNRMMDIKLANQMREQSSSATTTTQLASILFLSSSPGQPTSSSSPRQPPSLQPDLHEQIFRMQTLLSTKTEQLNILRQMISSNKSMYERNLSQLLKQHEDEMMMKRKMMTTMKDQLDEALMKNMMMSSSENVITRKWEAVQTQVDDLSHRLSSSELERKTLNSLLRLAIQHKLILLNKLKQHGIPIDLYDHHDNHVDQSQRATATIYQPITSFQHLQHHEHRDPINSSSSSFKPLLYTPANKR